MTDPHLDRVERWFLFLGFAIPSVVVLALWSGWLPF